jgi:predicted HTH transcriptional regulator
VNTYLNRLIAEGEHQRLDFKFEISDARKIARTLVAFANTDGGRLLIGVKDNGAIAGVRSEEEVFMLEAAAGMYCRPPVEFTTKEWQIDKKIVLEVIIAKSPLKPHYAEGADDKWHAYIRVGDQNFPANRLLIRFWKNENAARGVFLPFTDKERLLLQFLETNRNISLSKYIRAAAISRQRAENILLKFLLLKIIEFEFTGENVYYKLRKGEIEK